MSYILDAVRKSEQERQIAAGRGVGMLFPVLVERQPRAGGKPWAIAALVVLLALGAAAAIAWFSGYRPQALRPFIAEARLPEKPVPVEPPEAPPTLAAPLAPLPSPPADPALARPTTIEATPAAPASESPKRRSTASPRGGPTRPVDANKAPPAKPPDGSAGAVPAGLPAVVVSGYIDDPAGGRLAIVNDKLLREGDELAPGLRLESIAGDTAVFNYKGQRFRR